MRAATALVEVSHEHLTLSHAFTSPTALPRIPSIRSAQSVSASLIEPQPTLLEVHHHRIVAVRYWGRYHITGWSAPLWTSISSKVPLVVPSTGECCCVAIDTADSGACPPRTRAQGIHLHPRCNGPIAARKTRTNPDFHPR